MKWFRILKKKRFWILIGLVVYLYLQNTWIEVEEIDLDISGFNDNLVGMRIAHLSDIHIPQNGPSIEKIAREVDRQGPDIIVVTGDIIDKRCDFDEEEFELFCHSISKIAPTYVVTGNHEIWRGNLDVWTRVIEENNMILLDNTTNVIQYEGSDIALIGLKDGQKFKSENYSESLKAMPKILLTHRPDSFVSEMKRGDGLRPNIVFSGHIHGGQFRLPFSKKGLISPNIEFFPKYVSGLYGVGKNVNLIMSRGLGNSIIPFRINNRPHLVIIQLRTT